MERYIFGVDIGGTTIKLGLFLLGGRLLEKWEIPTRTMNGGAYVLPDAVSSIKAAMERHKIADDQIEGIGVPGPVDEAGTVHRCVNLGWDEFNIEESMRQLFPEIPNVKAGNDATLATLGELWCGGGRGYGSAAMFTLGTGVGGGIAIGRITFRGFHGGAGEWGHIVMNPEEKEVCNCGKRGCLEQYASATGIVRVPRRLLQESSQPSQLRNYDKITARIICDLARKGDGLSETALDECSDYLGRAMSYIACAVDPEVF
jgi:glucokinase